MFSISSSLGDQIDIGLYYRQIIKIVENNFVIQDNFQSMVKEFMLRTGKEEEEMPLFFSENESNA